MEAHRKRVIELLKWRKMSLPLPQDFIDAHLNELKSEFKCGRIDKLFSAIRFCGNEGIPMPDWVVNAFFRATSAWYSMRARTLDEAFGITPLPKKRFRAEQRRRNLRPAIYQRVKHLHSKGESISKELFKKVGVEYGAGSTFTSECYSEWIKFLEEVACKNRAFDKLLDPFIVPGEGSNRTIHNTKPRAGRPRKKR